MKEYKYIIIGAGLSGLTTGYELLKKGIHDFLILEGRPIVGGRVKSAKGIDMGATWIHQPHSAIQNLCAELQINLFPQYSAGKSIYVQNPNMAPKYFESDPRDVSYRIAGGTIALIEALQAKLADKIITSHAVSSVLAKGDHLVIESANETYRAGRAVVTLPPTLAKAIQYSPTLPNSLVSIMAGKHTWMSNAIKVGIAFKSPFWREDGLSGTLMGQNAPVMELYDHVSANETEFALIGFIHEAMRGLSNAERKTAVLNYLSRYLGSEVQNYIAYEEKDWSLDSFTHEGNIIPRYLGANYGDVCFNDLFMNGKLLFSGTETAPIHGGYLEGAVLSGVRAVNLLTA